MSYLIFFISWFAGLFIFSFTIIPILIILIFGIPTSNRLEKLKVLKPNNGIAKRYVVSSLVLGTMFFALIWLINSVFPSSMIGFLFGGGIVLLFGIGKLGINEKNIEDYIESNKKYFLDPPSTVRYVILGWKRLS